VGLDDCDDVTLVALSFFTAAAKRGMELADAFRARGKQVVAGGLFPTMMPDTVAPHVDAVVVGEAEGVWPEVLRDAAAGKLKPRYTESEQVDLSTLPLPRVDLYLDREGPRYHPDDYPVQTSRGCPLACYACALPTSMGKKLREYPLDHVLGQIDQLNRRGKLASFTEDTSFFVFGGVQRRFAELLDRIAAQGGPAKVSYIGISMPMILATPASVFAQMTRAGIKMFYLVGGFDPITQGAFTGDNPKAERRALDAIRKCHDLGIEPYTSFLVGNEDDNAGTFDRMLAFADAANIRKAEFAIMTPYPGTPVWHRLVARGASCTATGRATTTPTWCFAPNTSRPSSSRRATSTSGGNSTARGSRSATTTPSRAPSSFSGCRLPTRARTPRVLLGVAGGGLRERHEPRAVVSCARRGVRLRLRRRHRRPRHLRRPTPPGALRVLRRGRARRPYRRRAVMAALRRVSRARASSWGPCWGSPCAGARAPHRGSARAVHHRVGVGVRARCDREGSPRPGTHRE
jgi:hypothetical protein